MCNFRKTVFVIIELLLSGLSLISCSSGSTDWLDRASWAQSGPVCYSTPLEWSSESLSPDSVWSELMKSHNGLGMLSRTDPTGSAELTIAMFKPLTDEEGSDHPDLNAFTESAAGILMAGYEYLNPGPAVETEISGHAAYEIKYRGSRAGTGIEGRFISIDGSTGMAIIACIAPAEEWERFDPVYDKTKTDICFATEKDADGNWKPCFPWLR